MKCGSRAMLAFGLANLALCLISLAVTLWIAYCLALGVGPEPVVGATAAAIIVAGTIVFVADSICFYRYWRSLQRARDELRRARGRLR